MLLTIEIQKSYQKFLDGPLDVVRSFQTFLNGTNSRKTSNQSLLKYLPKEIVLKIWFEYACAHISETDLVKLDLLPILQEKYRRNPNAFFNFDLLLRLAVRHGRMDMYIWLSEEVEKKGKRHKHGDYYSGDLLVAVDEGNLDFVKFLLPNVALERHYVALQNNASKFGHLHILQYLYEIGPKTFSRNCINLAATYGHLDVIKWIFPRTSDPCSFNAFFGAVENEQYEVLDWLFRNVSMKSPMYTAETILLHTRSHQLSDEMIKYLYGWYSG